MRGIPLVMRTVADNYTINNLSYYVSSGAVSTEGHFAQKHGRWEVSVKLPRPNESPSYTLHSSIWLNSHSYSQKPSGKGCPDEIDVIEQYAGPHPPSPFSRGCGSVHMHNAACVHTPARNGLHNAGDMIYGLNGDFTSNWTVFTLDWTTNWISFAINGKPVVVYTNATTVQTLTDVQPLILTATVMERVATLPGDKFPQEYWVDYVRIYQWDDDDA